MKQIVLRGTKQDVVNKAATKSYRVMSTLRMLSSLIIIVVEIMWYALGRIILANTMPKRGTDLF